MAKNENTARAVEKSADDGTVEVRLFRDSDKYRDDVFVAVNGRAIQIRRGETVRVGKEFAEVLENSMRQENAAADIMERESTGYREQARSLGV